EFPWCCTDSRLIFKARSIKKHHEAWYNKYILYWLDRERSNMIVTITRKDLMDLGYGPSFSRDIIREAKSNGAERLWFLQHEKIRSSACRSCGRNIGNNA